MTCRICGAAPDQDCDQAKHAEWIRNIHHREEPRLAGTWDSGLGDVVEDLETLKRRNAPRVTMRLAGALHACGHVYPHDVADLQAVGGIVAWATRMGAQPCPDCSPEDLH